MNRKSGVFLSISSLPSKYGIGTLGKEAYKFIDAIENIDVRNATENEYNRLLRHQETIQKQNDIKTSNEIMQKVYTAYENGEDIYSIMREVNTSNMSLEQKGYVELSFNSKDVMQAILVETASDEVSQTAILMPIRKEPIEE